jgi:hypothetical protein
MGGRSMLPSGSRTFGTPRDTTVPSLRGSPPIWSFVVLDAIGGDQRRELARPAVFLSPGKRVVCSVEEAVEGIIIALGEPAGRPTEKR